MNVYLVLLICLMGCSVYKSTGRKNFEARVPGNLVTGNLGQGLAIGNCWSQPKTDALWSLEAYPQLMVMKNSENPDKLEVCSVYSPEDSASDSRGPQSLGR
jgi:hypothetical protein